MENEKDPISYTLTLTEKHTIAHQTMEFRFKKPEGFTYRAGQSMRVKVPGTDEERTLSLVTAPHQSDLAFAVRIRGSEFKKNLKRFEVGDQLIASGPYGKFGLHEDAMQPALYIAGGIGITIYLSILSHIEHNKLPHSITLLYSNRTQEDIAYLPRLREIANHCKNIRVIPVLTKETPENWTRPNEHPRQNDPVGLAFGRGGELGRIDKVMIEKYSTDPNTLFHVAATPDMVDDIEKLLLSMGVPEERIKAKRFRGY